MTPLIEHPPYSLVEPVTEVRHGVAVVDPYRWLEDQNSPRTRAWIEHQTFYARAYLDKIPGRERIRERVREFLAVETYDSLQVMGGCYYFRKRLPGQEQPCICMREGAEGKDQLLVDPLERGTGKYTAVNPLCVSPDGRLLLYEVKEGGERTGTFELLEIADRKPLPDILGHGFLRGFAFAPNSKSFCYVHEAVDAKPPLRHAVYHHVIGKAFSEDREIFCAGQGQNIRLGLFSDHKRLAFLVYRFSDKTVTDIYLTAFNESAKPTQILSGVSSLVGLRLLDDRILAITDRDAPNRRIVEIRLRDSGEPEWIDIIPETDRLIDAWYVVGDRIVVSSTRDMTHQIQVFDFSGKALGELPMGREETLRILASASDRDEILAQTESFTEPIRIFRCSLQNKTRTVWAKRSIPFDSPSYCHSQIWFRSKDGERVPMYLVGRTEVLRKGGNPTIMTAYGGYGVSMTPQFSVLVALLMERGCLFALPNIRGGWEFGVPWHEAARRRNRQTAYDDFLSAAEWLLATGRTAPGKLGIFGGSNSGLLVGAALTQRPDLFCAALCMVPILDMLRYHLFDGAQVWKEEFGTADDPEDFAALAKYSPYHHVRDGAAYPATMIVSGDADRNCNPLHARKMTARLQAANRSGHPILLHYGKWRGHAPVLPLSEQIEALTDRIAFLCEHLQISV